MRRRTLSFCTPPVESTPRLYHSPSSPKLPTLSLIVSDVERSCASQKQYDTFCSLPNGTSERILWLSAHFRAGKGGVGNLNNSELYIYLHLLLAEHRSIPQAWPVPLPRVASPAIRSSAKSEFGQSELSALGRRDQRRPTRITREMSNLREEKGNRRGKEPRGGQGMERK